MCIIPKTVDNDLVITDSCPGFGSAKYIATSTLGSLDVQSMSETSTKMFILEVMGRHAGWMAPSSILARNNQNTPHIILLPEVAFNQKLSCRSEEKRRKCRWLLCCSSFGRRKKL